VAAPAKVTVNVADHAAATAARCRPASPWALWWGGHDRRRLLEPGI